MKHPLMPYQPPLNHSVRTVAVNDISLSSEDTKVKPRPEGKSLRAPYHIRFVFFFSCELMLQPEKVEKARPFLKLVKDNCGLPFKSGNSKFTVAYRHGQIVICL